MLPVGYRSTQPIMFVYWDKKVRRNLGLVYSNKTQSFFVLTSKRVPEEFAVGLN